MTASALPGRMRGAVLIGPERIEVRELAVPVPGPGEILLRVGAATTCGTDLKTYLRGGHPRMLRVPALFGHEVAGEVAALGAGVSSVRPGERIAVANSAPCLKCSACRAGRENLCEDLEYLNGAFAEYLLVPARFVRTSLYPVGAGMPFERAALAEPLACVVHGFEACGLDGGGAASEIVVYGAGPVGLLFTAVLARAGNRVILADPNPPRLEVGLNMGAAEAVVIERGGGQSGRLRERTEGGRGAEVVVECTGSPVVWTEAIATVRPGGLVNLFGGCAPGTTVGLDAHLVHYGEVTVKGAYHHRPATFRRAVELLEQPDFPAEQVISGAMPIDGVEEALRRMVRREALKIAVSGG